MTTEVSPVRAAEERSWREQLRRPLQVYAASRMLTLLVAAIVALSLPGVGFMAFLTRWDANWFFSVARHGYPSVVPEVAGRVAESNLAFFPLFPLLMRLVSWALPVSDAVAGLLVALVSGAAAVVILHRIASIVAGRQVADRAAVLFSFFPGSMVLSMPYSEGLMVALSAGCLLFLLQRRWLAAGVCAGLATACRPTAVALVAACLWQAGLAVRDHRQWRALVAPALAPTGILSFFAFLWVRTGEPLAYLRAEEAWKTGPGLGRATRELTLQFLHSPLALPAVTIVGLCVAFAVVSGVVLARRRWPGVLSVYTFSLVTLAVSARSDGLRPRDLLVAFPLLMAVAAASEGVRFRLLRGAFAGALVVSLYVHNLGTWGQP